MAQNKYTSNQQFTLEPNQKHEANTLFVHLYKVTVLDKLKCLRFFSSALLTYESLRKSSECISSTA